MLRSHNNNNECKALVSLPQQKVAILLQFTPDNCHLLWGVVVTDLRKPRKRGSNLAFKLYIVSWASCWGENKSIICFKAELFYWRNPSSSNTR